MPRPSEPLRKLAPGRPFMGISTGDTAVLEAGLQPAGIEELASYVEKFRPLSPATPVIVAAGGPRSVRRAAAYADQLVFGQGFSPASVTELLNIVRQVRRDRTQPEPPVWLFVIASLVEEPSADGHAREDVREWVLGQAAQAFAGSLDARGVDPEFGERIQRFLDPSRPSGRELSDRERTVIEKFLFDRYAVATTPEVAAERVLEAIESTGIRRAFITFFSNELERVIGLATSRLLPRLLG